MEKFFSVKCYIGGELVEEFPIPVIINKTINMGSSSQCEVNIKNNTDFISEKHVQFYCVEGDKYKLKVFSPFGIIVGGKKISHLQSIFVENGVDIYLNREKNIKIVFSPCETPPKTKTLSKKKRVTKKQKDAHKAAKLKIKKQVSKKEASLRKTTTKPLENPLDGLDRKTKTIRSSTLSDFYKTLEDHSPEVPEKPNKGIKYKKKQDLRSTKFEEDMALFAVYKKLFISGIVALVLFFIIFVSMFFITTDPKPKYVAKTSPVEEVSQTDVKKPSRFTKKNPEAYAFLKQSFRNIYLNPEGPSQQFYNNLLREIYNGGKPFFETEIKGDLFNLIGRLYYYKIHLDYQENLFKGNAFDKKNWIEIWKKEAIESLEIAKNEYRKSKTTPSFNLPLMNWMPEKSWHKQPFLKYENSNEAIADIDKYLKTIR